jgi:hypothetical protein
MSEKDKKKDEETVSWGTGDQNIRDSVAKRRDPQDIDDAIRSR